MPIPQLRSRSYGSCGSKENYSRPKNSPLIHRKKKQKLIKKLISFALVSGLFLLIFGSIYISLISRNLPNPNELINREVAQSTKIYDRTGEHVLYEISGDQKRTLVALQDIPDNVKQATIAIEDKNFYTHGAFSVWAMFRTAVTNVLFGRSAGGSTLTQQFIKNAVLTPEKTITRKIKELILAYRLEKKFSKDEILQMYLNEIPYGSNAYGVEAASQKYFDKNVKDLALEEAAILAAIVQMPTRYSPYGPNKDILLGRKDYVLTLLAEQGYISEQERDEAQKKEIVFKNPGTKITAPHFVMYIKEIVAEKYGEQMVEQDGLKIYTTLDLYKQKIAEEVIAARSEDYPKKYNANNAALISLDPKTGQILAMVGSRDYFDDSINGQVNVTTRPRQPGSSMKPIVYAALFEKGYTPNTILYDTLTNFSTNSTPYSPHNYDDKERGPVTVRQALAGSLNIPAVKAIYLADINTVIDLAENMGYTTLYPRNRFGLSLVLGGGEVKLLEHTNAYSAFARDGQISAVTGILKIEDKNGRIIEEYRATEKKALSSKVARMINNVLSDNQARAYIFGEKNYLTLGNRPVAAKTGTTNDYHDAWTIGYTPSLVTGVWVGNSDNKAMTGRADGSILAAPIWHDFMDKVLGDTPQETFKEPEDYKTGKPVLDGEVSLGQNGSPIHHSILYYVNKDDPLGSTPNNPDKDPQFTAWENSVQEWANKNATSSPDGSGNGEFNVPENLPTLKIDSPTANETITVSELKISLTADAPRGINRTEYYINGNLWESRWNHPEPFIKEINFLNNGYHSLRVKVCDDVKNCREEEINFNLLIKNNPVSAGKNSLILSGLTTGVAATALDFPLALELQIAKPERVAEIRLFSRNSDTGEVLLIGEFAGPFGQTISTDTGPAPAVGSYAVYGELKDWNGETITSNEIKITVSQ